ncbi:hypothetical protein MY10362_006409 [Beauveria mimosiformis]
MKTFTSVAALFSLINGIAAYPLEGVSVASCKFGSLVCQGEGKFGICNSGNKVIFMDVAPGTKCVCSGSDCTIAGGGSNPPQNTPVPTPSAPQAPPTSTSQAVAPTSSAPQAPPTSTSQAVTPTPAVGGQFKEVPTATLPAPSTSSAASSQPSAPATNPDLSNGGYIKAFMGKGDAAAGWPEESSWVKTFEDMWDANLKNVIYKSCTSFQQDNNSAEESADIKSAIEEVSKSSGVDARFILAIVMQESNGCVRVPTTANGVTNPGLMQTHNGAHTCHNVKPCPKSTIKGMIEDGVNGTADGDGLKQLLAKAGGSGASTYYKAARMYNSGSIDASGDLEKGIATHCYSSDVANRLSGWSAGVGGCHVV